MVKVIRIPREGKEGVGGNKDRVERWRERNGMRKGEATKHYYHHDIHIIINHPFSGSRLYMWRMTLQLPRPS